MSGPRPPPEFLNRVSKQSERRHLTLARIPLTTTTTPHPPISSPSQSRTATLAQTATFPPASSPKISLYLKSEERKFNSVGFPIIIIRGCEVGGAESLQPFQMPPPPPPSKKKNKRSYVCVQRMYTHRGKLSCIMGSKTSLHW